MIKLYIQKVRKCGECPNCIEKDYKNNYGYCYIQHHGGFYSKKGVKLDIIDDECILDEAK